MRKVLCFTTAAMALAALAAPTVSGIRLTRDAKTAQIRVDYAVADEPAVVTAAFKVNGSPIAENLYTNLSGEVNCLVQPGPHRFILKPGSDWTFADRDVEVLVRAWATNAPPDYIVFDLPSRGAVPPKYYVSTNAFPAPLSDIRYRTSQLVMRRIPAANVEFRMGAPTDECGSESDGTLTDTGALVAGRSRWAILSEDYYLGIYPVTYAQQTNAVANFYTGFWSNDGSPYKDVRRDDWPVSGFSYLTVRCAAHEDKCQGPGSAGFVDYPFWPRDGHRIDVDIKRCSCRTAGANETSFLGYWRSRYGFSFDLPTEAQWEFACRAGTRGPCYVQPERADAIASGSTTWMEALDACAWTLRNCTNATVNAPTAQSVGQLRPNAFGLYDMLGNVAEWCLDLSTRAVIPERADPVTDPVGADPRLGFGVSRLDMPILKGGCFFSKPQFVNAAARVQICTFYANQSFRNGPNLPAGIGNWAGGYRLALPCHAVR